MADKTTDPAQDQDRMSIAEGLIHDFVDVFQGEAKAQSKAEKAKGEAEAAREGSIKALADRLSSLHNVPLDEEMIEMIALSAAEKIAGKNQNVLKARKSEIKLLIRNRDKVKATVETYEKYRDKMKEKDEKFSLNLRTKTLSALRKLQKDDDLTPADLVRKEHAEANREVPESEKAMKLINKLLDSPALIATTAQGRKVMDERAVRALETLQLVIEKGAQPPKESKEKAEDDADDFDLTVPDDVLAEALPDTAGDLSDLDAAPGGDAPRSEADVAEADDDMGGDAEQPVQEAVPAGGSEDTAEGEDDGGEEGPGREPEAVVSGKKAPVAPDFDLDELMSLT